MSSHRVAPLTIPVIAATAALTVGTAIAVADANDDAYVADLQKSGVTMQNPSGAPVLGKQVCTDLKSGRTPDQIVADIVADSAVVGAGINNQQATTIVNSSKKYYCP